MYFAIAMAVMQAVQQYQQQRQQQAAAQASMQAQQQQQDYQNQLAWRQQEQDANQRRDLLKRQSAKNRAALAASGMSAGDGSAAALLNGLQQKTSQEIASNYEDALLRHQMDNMPQLSRSSGGGLSAGLQLAQQGMSVLKPLFSGGNGRS